MHSTENQATRVAQPFEGIQTARHGSAAGHLIMPSPHTMRHRAGVRLAAHHRDVRVCWEKVENMVHFNGRWKRPDEAGKRNDPDTDFPIRQAFTDCSGQTRSFVISYFRLHLGFGVHAEEEGKEGQGFFFREFDANSPYLALGRLCARIREALATRHIEQREPGNFQATHQTVRGRISYGDGDVAFVIDGQPLTLRQFGKMLETFEGFEFRLEIQD